MRTLLIVAAVVLALYLMRPIRLPTSQRSGGQGGGGDNGPCSGQGAPECA